MRVADTQGFALVDEKHGCLPSAQNAGLLLRGIGYFLTVVLLRRCSNVAAGEVPEVRVLKRTSGGFPEILNSPFGTLNPNPRIPNPKPQTVKSKPNPRSLKP